jgi:hypothetical protein
MLFLKWFKNSIENKLKKITKWCKMKLKKKSFKKREKNQVSPSKPRKPELISQPYNPLNSRLWVQPIC